MRIAHAERPRRKVGAGASKAGPAVSYDLANESLRSWGESPLLNLLASISVALPPPLPHTHTLRDAGLWAGRAQGGAGGPHKHQKSIIYFF
jgi:hypothetical protein